MLHNLVPCWHSVVLIEHVCFGGLDACTKVAANVHTREEKVSYLLKVQISPKLLASPSVPNALGILRRSSEWCLAKRRAQTVRGAIPRPCRCRNAKLMHRNHIWVQTIVIHRMISTMITLLKVSFDLPGVAHEHRVSESCLGLKWAQGHRKPSL